MCDIHLIFDYKFQFLKCRACTEVRSLSEVPNTIMASVWGLLVFASAANAFAVIEEVPSYRQKDQTDNTAEEILSSEGNE